MFGCDIWFCTLFCCPISMPFVAQSAGKEPPARRDSQGGLRKICSSFCCPICVPFAAQAATNERRIWSSHDRLCENRHLFCVPLYFQSGLVGGRNMYVWLRYMVLYSVLLPGRHAACCSTDGQGAVSTSEPSARAPKYLLTVLLPHLCAVCRSSGDQ